jgi:hypothetical protein
VTSTASLVRPELVVRPDFARRRPGRDLAAIADTLRIATAGDYDQGLAKLNLSQRQVPIVVKLPTMRAPISSCSRLPCRARAAGAAGQRGHAGGRSGPAEIARYDRLRNVNFEIELNGVPLGEVRRPRSNCPLKKLPPGVIQTTVGDAEAMGELFASFGLAMATGVLCIYVVLVQGLRAAGDHPGGAGAVHPGRLPGAVRHAVVAVHALDDRPDHADGHRHQELHPADRLRGAGAARARPEPLGGAARRLPQARGRS